MSIQSFLQAEKGDPDWLFSPDEYFGKPFKLSDANTIELKEGCEDSITLRHNPTESGLLAKNLKIDVREGSTLDLMVLNDAVPKLQQVFIYDIKIRTGGILNMGIFAKGGKFNKHILQVTIEEGGTLACYGYMSNTVGGTTEIISKVHQQGHESMCTQLIGAQAGAHSQTAWQTIVRIDEDAEIAETGVESINLITGSGGRCWSKPDISSENITSKIRYGSQTACLDSNITFYLASKGVPAVDSEKLVIRNFQEHIFDLIKEDDLREEVEQLFNTQE